MLIGAATASKEGFMALLPVLALTGLAALARPWRSAAGCSPPAVLAPKFSRLNPISGLGKIFSMQGPIALGMSILKTLVVGGLAGWAMWTPQGPRCSGSSRSRSSLALAETMHLIVVCCGMAIAGLFLVAALDVPVPTLDAREETAHEQGRSEARAP